MNFRKVLNGYAAQARWLNSNLVTKNAEGDWLDLGWTKLGNGSVKPVFKTTEGVAVVILQGKTHLQAVALEVPAGCVFATEDEARAAKAGW